MARLALTAGAYQSRSLLAGAQRCVNLYPEQAPPDSQAPVPVTHFVTPGLTLKGTPPFIDVGRGAYRCGNGDLYVVVGTTVYYVNSVFSFTAVGTIAFASTPVSMSDNGLVLCIVDGSTTGYVVDLATRAFGTINSAAFYGADRVDYVDTYFVFNRPGTTQFYISVGNPTFAILTGGAIATGSITSGGGSYTNATYTAKPLTGGTGSGATATIVVSGNVVTSVTIINPGDGYRPGDVLSAAPADIGGGSGFAWTVSTVTGQSFDSLDIAGKTGGSDPLVVAAVIHRELWLVGGLTSEVWVDVGAADFAFQALPGAFVEHGCAAKYSVAVQDSTGFWLSQDRQGNGIVVMTNGYSVKRISTHAIEAEIQRYSRIDDAIGGCYQIDGHSFYVLTFPAADVTWCMELATGQWHQWAYTDSNGALHRHRGMSWVFAYGYNLTLDWQNGQIYEVSSDTFTDFGNPIVRIRTFPHLIDDDNRITYQSFTADMQVGTLVNSIVDDPPQVSLRWSDDRGASYGSPVMQSLGSAGQYKTSMQWNRLGYARDRVFELSWSVAANVSLNGAFIETKPSKS